MILYKNVDICDLPSIMQKGVLSMDECGNDNLDTGKRVQNDTSVVYLFSPIGEKNSFPNYGVALLEVECSVAENAMASNDYHREDYREYVTDKVDPASIKRIVIPRVFRDYIKIPPQIPVTWCGLAAKVYDEDGDKKVKPISPKLLEQFCKTAPLMDSTEVNYFRGVSDDCEMIDLKDIEYIF